MSLRATSNPASITREAMARVAVTPMAAPRLVACHRAMTVKSVGRGLLHLVDAASGEILGIGTDAAVLGRTRDFFQ